MSTDKADNTLDTIRPSDNGTFQQEMSYLFGRDPSIITYGQRPVASNDSKKNLISVYEMEELDSREDYSSTRSVSLSTETVKVYLRMKPFPRKMKLTKQEEEAYKIINSTTLCTKLPILDNNISSLKKSQGSYMPLCRKFTFTQTFGPEITQLQIFEQAVKQQMTDFLAGQNSTVMSYGTTNSGKSYSLHGTTTSPGIIPRGLEFVFSNINPKPMPCYKPINYCDVINLNADEVAVELKIKTKLLTSESTDKNQYISAYKQMQNLLKEESPLRSSHCNDAYYSVWVSFAEIYNETIYDLLSNDCQERRPPLKLATDNYGRTFIKGLKTICVNSGSEAFQVLMVGQDNLKVATTTLNARSSRSHCIFTIKLLKYYTENTPEAVKVSTFAFCDLAGSERLKKTLNVGDRLKEAQNINTSLLVLGRCLKSIYENQSVKQRQEVVGPFRESKLTRLFQRALSGKEHISLIVNINPVPSMYTETQNVLSFSAIAKKIIIQSKERKKKTSTSRFSQMVAQSMKTVTDWDTVDLEIIEKQSSLEELNSVVYIHPEDYEDVVDENEKLKKEILALKNSVLNRDFEVRQEMANTYSVMMKNLEASWKNRIKDVEEQQEDMLAWSVNQIETYYKEKLSELKSRKRRRSCDDDSNDDNEAIAEELEIDNNRLTTKVVTLKEIIKELRKEKETISAEKNKVTFELVVAKEDLNSVKNLLQAAQEDINCDEDATYYIEELKKQLSSKENCIKNLKQLLDEAKTEYIITTSDIKEMEQQLKEKDEALAEDARQIEDLEESLEHANVCLAKQTRIVENLEEILNHQMNEQSSKTDDKCHEDDDKIERKEIGNQTDIWMSNLKNDIGSINFVDNDSQTIVGGTKEQFNQTSFVELAVQENSSQTSFIVDEKLIDTEEQLTHLKNKVIELEAQLVRESSHVKEVMKELTDKRKSEKKNKEKYNISKVKIEELNNCVNLFEERFLVVYSENKSLQNSLIEVQDVKSGLEMKIADYEQQIDKLRNELTLSADKEQRHSESLSEHIKNVALFKFQLSEVKEKLDNRVSKCLNEHEPKIDKLEKEISAANEKVDLKTQCIDAHAERILQLEKDLIEANEFRAKVNELEEALRKCKEEKDDIQTLLDKDSERLKLLKIQLEEANFKEQEKENEIADLQKEIKNMIQSNVNDCNTDKEMEQVMKSTVKDMAETKEALSRTEELYRQLEINSNKEIDNLKVRLKTFEDNAKYVQLLQEGAQNRQEENERLRNINDELRNKLTDKEREMESFSKNRDETITRYESLVKSLQEDVERHKREVMRYQELFLRQTTPTPSKEDIRKLKDELRIKTRLLEQAQEKLKKIENSKKCEENLENIMDNEVIVDEVQTRRRRGRKVYLAPSPGTDEVVLVEQPDSESKLSTKRTALAPPTVNPSVETRRTRRKKKLFVQDEMCTDVKPCENVSDVVSPSSCPSSATRNLRTRRRNNL